MASPQIPFGGRVITLRSPAAQTLELPRTVAGAPQSSKVLAWEPDDKEAMTVEVRARMVATSAPATVIPVVTCYLEVGHGHRVWTEPGEPQRGADLDVEAFSLPGRGIVLSLSARQLRIGFQNAGGTQGENVESTTVAVSFNPRCCANGAAGSVFPSDFLFPEQVKAFPMGAREFRCSEQDSTNVPGGGPNIDFFSVSGFEFSANQSQLDNGWWPIPHEAAFYRMDRAIGDGNYIHFR